MFKVGDEVVVKKVTHTKDSDGCDRSKAIYIGKVFKVVCNTAHFYPYLYHLENTGGTDWVEEELELKNKIMNVKDLYLSLFVSEPQKSRQKAGIVDKDNMPTEDGLKMMVKWLLDNNPNVADFDAKVVQPIIEQMDKECKK